MIVSELPKIQLLQGDCMDLMKSTPDNFYELAIVDPPYGIDAGNMTLGNARKKYKEHKNWDKSIPPDEYFNELFRVSKNQIIWGGNYFTLPLVRGWIFWDKNVPEGVDFGDGELAWTSFDSVLRKAKIKYSGFQGTESGGKIHPTQKPIKLYKWLIEKYMKNGGGNSRYPSRFRFKRNSSASDEYSFHRHRIRQRLLRKCCKTI